MNLNNLNTVIKGIENILEEDKNFLVPNKLSNDMVAQLKETLANVKRLKVGVETYNKSRGKKDFSNLTVEDYLNK